VVTTRDDGHAKIQKGRTMSDTTSSRAAVNVNELLDRGHWGGYQRWLVFMTALTIVFDGADNQLLGIAIPSIMSTWGVARGAFAPVVAMGYLGMAMGGGLAGLAGDKFGRRTALLGSMGIFGVATLAVATCDSVQALALLRLLAGIGLGGAIPNAAALAAEYVPAPLRPVAVTLTIVCVPLGGTIAGLVAIPALPALGWRTLFAIGGVTPLLAAITLAWLLPESPRYLASRPSRWPELAHLLRRMGHRVDANATFAEPARAGVARVPLRAIFQRDYLVDTFALWVAFFSCLLAVYLGFSWLPSIITAAGLGPSVASTAITTFNLGGVFGALTGGVLITRAGSKPIMLGLAAGAVAGALVLSAMTIDRQTGVGSLLLMLAITGGFINAVQTTMFALAANVYPTVMRATGVGTATAFGRIGAILVGYAGPWALEHGGSTAFFRLMSGAMATAFVALAIVGRHVPAPRAARGERRE
jgi:AAHS family 4-hydroxybenzoate transporter-like MFS transporter